MKFKIAVLPGDGIGPEISVQGVDVMSAVCEKFGHEVSYEYAICGADAIDKVGDPFPEETYQVCKNADAVLFSAVGDPRFDNDPTAKVRPEQGLLAMRKKLGLFANIRPVQTFKCLIHKSPLRAELEIVRYGAECYDGYLRFGCTYTRYPVSTFYALPDPYIGKLFDLDL